MGEHGDAGGALALAPDVRRSEPLMHLAMPLPGDDLDEGLRRGITRQILVRQHDDARHTERLDDFLCVRRGAADVGLSLDRGRGIDVGQDRHARIALAQEPDIGCRDRRRKGAPGPEIGDRKAGGTSRA
jgi:hypothetical protein